MEGVERRSPEGGPIPDKAISGAEVRARRSVVIGLVLFGLLLAGMIALLVVLAIDAYRSPAQRTAGTAVVSLLRDAAIILAAFETLLIGVLLVLLTLQVQALVALLRDEIRPMLEALNDTVATVRGTAEFVSHSVVSPTIRTASFLAGLRQVAKEIVELGRGSGKR